MIVYEFLFIINIEIFYYTKYLLYVRGFLTYYVFCVNFIPPVVLILTFGVDSMSKKIISLLLCLCIIFGSGISAFAQSGYPETVTEFVRITDGIGELLRSFIGLFSLKFKYPDCTKLHEIPELDNGYVPQGFCFIESENTFAVSFYSNEDDNSILSLVDAESDKRLKTVKLCYDDGSPCKAHVGGVADIGDSLLISSGKSVRRLKISDVKAAEDYGYVQFCGTLKTDMQASYVASYENYLFVGQFYSFTLDGSYDTPEEQRVYTPSGKRNYAMCEKFDLSDMDKVFSDGSAVPLMVISVPNSVQGVAYDGETFVTSSSYTFNNASKIRYYNLAESEQKFCMNGSDVPLYFLEEKDAVKTVKVPPMSEGIDFYNGRVAGIFESGAQKFWYARVRTPYICTFA